MLLLGVGLVSPWLLSADADPSLAAPPADAVSDDSDAVEVGALFTVVQPGSAVGVRFYKGAGNDGPHVGTLWNARGRQLASVTFAAETATGWQRARFDSPVPLTVGATYTVSYFAPHGHYVGVENAFAESPLLSGRVSQRQGVYAYGAGSTFPTRSWHDSNYYVDVMTTVREADGDGDGDGGGVLDSPPAAGTPSDAALTASGGMTVTRPGTVLDGLAITGSVVVAADDVTISDSSITGTGDYGVVVRSGSVTIEDTTISGFDNGVGGDDYVADGVEVTALRDDGFKLGSRVTIVGSWCHDLTPSAGAHSDCVQLQSGETDVVVEDSWLDPGTSEGNAAVFLSPSLGPSSPGPVTISGNVLGGGNYTLFCVDGNDGEFVVDDITVSGNRFLPTGRYGPTSVNVMTTWVGNTWFDTGLPVLA